MKRFAKLGEDPGKQDDEIKEEHQPNAHSLNNQRPLHQRGIELAGRKRWNRQSQVRFRLWYESILIIRQEADVLHSIRPSAPYLGADSVVAWFLDAMSGRSHG